METKKKLLLFLAVTVVSLVFAFPAFGAPKVMTEEEAIGKAKGVLGNLVKPNYEVNVHLSANHMNSEEQIWNISWYDTQSRGYSSDHLSVSLNANTGEIISFYVNSNQTQNNKGKKLLSRDETKKIAENFIKKMQPEAAKEVKVSSKNAIYSSDSLNLNYNFYFQREDKGLEIEGDGFNLAVNGITGQITQYNYQWSKDLEGAGDIVPVAEIEKIFADNIGVYLAYEQTGDRNADGLPIFKPVYRLNFGSNIINAKTGKPVDYMGKEKDWSKAQLYDQEFTLQPGEKVYNKKPATQKVSYATAEQKVKEFMKLLGETGEVEHSGGSTGISPWGKEESFIYTIIKDNTSRNYGGKSIQIDSYSGEIKGFNLQSGEEIKKVTNPISEEEAYKIALDLLNKIKVDTKSLAKAEAYYSDENIYSFNFRTIVNGIPSEHMNISVNLTKDGKIISYSSFGFNYGEFKTGTVISPEEAKKALLENLDLKLRYSAIWEPQTNSSKTILGYAHSYEKGSSLDAVTGKMVPFQYLNVLETKDNSEVKYPTSALNLLANNGLLPEQVDVNKNITKGEAIELVAKIIPYWKRNEGMVTTSSFKDVPFDSPLSRSVEAAVQVGILKPGGNFEPNKVMDRQTLAAWLVSASGYDDIAKLPISIELNITDKEGISAGMKNYIALAVGLDIIPAKDKKFLPKEQITWTEFADMLINALKQVKPE